MSGLVHRHSHYFRAPFDAKSRWPFHRIFCPNLQRPRTSAVVLSRVYHVRRNPPQNYPAPSGLACSRSFPSPWSHVPAPIWFTKRLVTASASRADNQPLQLANSIHRLCHKKKKAASRLRIALRNPQPQCGLKIFICAGISKSGAYLPSWS